MKASEEDKKTLQTDKHMTGKRDWTPSKAPLRPALIINNGEMVVTILKLGSFSVISKYHDCVSLDGEPVSILYNKTTHFKLSVKL